MVDYDRYDAIDDAALKFDTEHDNGEYFEFTESIKHAYSRARHQNRSNTLHILHDRLQRQEALNASLGVIPALNGVMNH